ncbi:MAG: TrkA family potassium uptake protein [Oscillospiraceae bacterium]|nr:TrkA family potassium uptake protein [Oscillospiraceae bacterium]
MTKTFLLIGLGRFGMQIAVKLNELKHEVMAVDKDEARVNNAIPYVTNAIIGDTTDEFFLNSLGIDNYDVCIVTIGEDFQSSLETTSLLKELGAKFVVSRASRDVHEKFLLRNGADDVIYPAKQIASWTATRYTCDHIFDYLELNEDYSIFEVAVPENWKGRAVGEIDIRKKFDINILGIKTNGKLSMKITADTVFENVESILVLGRIKDIQKCFHI